MTINQKRLCKYRFGFVLTTAAGNQTRYLNLRKYAERDPDVESVWAPISHWLDPNPFRKLPVAVQTRAIVSRQARPVMSQIGRLDAVMFHAFEPYLWAVSRGIFHKKPVIAWSQDNPPLADPADHPQAHYGEEYARSHKRQNLRFHLDLWCARHTGLFFPFSTWAASVLTRECKVSQDIVHPIHVGLDLETWPFVPPLPTPGPNSKVKILFVGGDFERKGGPLLLEVFAREFAQVAELHIVTKEKRKEVPEGVFQYCGLRPNDARLTELYAECDLFVLPTLADMSSWVALEAMATGRPVVISGTGGIPDIVEDGKTGFLVAPGDARALADRMRCLIDNADLRVAMGDAGRAKVERDFNASVSVPNILTQMKLCVDRRR